MSSENTEVFTFLSLSFNVTEAQKFVQNKKIQFIEIEGLAAYLPDPNSKIMQGFKVIIDQEKAMSDATDLTKPIILATYKKSHFLIDGWHRLYKAHQLGLVELPGYIINEKQTKELLI